MRSVMPPKCARCGLRHMGWVCYDGIDIFSDIPYPIWMGKRRDKSQVDRDVQHIREDDADGKEEDQGYDLG